jgi:sensor domain CHASE-containing protein
MENNKTGKYFKYAIGEVILVVIGILIALQINNANEHLKSENIKQNYYIQIAADLDKEVENINDRIIF